MGINEKKEEFKIYVAKSQSKVVCLWKSDWSWNSEKFNTEKVKNVFLKTQMNYFDHIFFNVNLFSFFYSFSLGLLFIPRKQPTEYTALGSGCHV